MRPTKLQHPKSLVVQDSILETAPDHLKERIKACVAKQDPLRLSCRQSPGDSLIATKWSMRASSQCKQLLSHRRAHLSGWIVCSSVRLVILGKDTGVIRYVPGDMFLADTDTHQAEHATVRRIRGHQIRLQSWQKAWSRDINIHSPTSAWRTPAVQ
jgi:hypothetical protein